MNLAFLTQLTREGFKVTQCEYVSPDSTGPQSIRDRPVLDSARPALSLFSRCQPARSRLRPLGTAPANAAMRTIKLVIVGESHTGKVCRGAHLSILHSTLTRNACCRPACEHKYATARHKACSWCSQPCSLSPVGSRVDIGLPLARISTASRCRITATRTSRSRSRSGCESMSCVLSDTCTDTAQDTAGQERFSSLSRAFFRGADAVLLVFDVNVPETLQSLRKWWETFCDYAPVPEDEAYRFCTVFVGNKIDLAAGTQVSGKPVVSEADARAFIESLLPSRNTSPSQPSPPESVATERPPPVTPSGSSEGLEDITNLQRSSSIDIRSNGHGYGDISYARHHKLEPTGSRATSRSRFAGTINTVKTGISVYHTPSSSLFNTSAFVSAPSSPPSPYGSPRPTYSRKRLSSSTLLLLKGLDDDSTLSDNDLDESPDTRTLKAGSQHEEPEEGPRLFFTSAKTGESVADVFAYVARRVVARAEWDETHIRDSLTMSEADSEITIRPTATSHFRQRISSGCCA